MTMALRFVVGSGLSVALLASCGGDSQTRSKGASGSGGTAGTNTHTGGSSGRASEAGRSAGGTSPGGRGGTAGSAAATSGAAGVGGSATAGSSGTGGAPSGGAGAGGGGEEAGAAGDGGAAGTPSTEPAVYSACQYGSGIGRILIAKKEGAECTVLILSMPGNDTLGLDLPSGIGVESAFRTTAEPDGCVLYAPPNGAAQATSGSGTVAWASARLDVDATLHFDSDPPSESLTAADLDYSAGCL
jgi:hypothetical protein